MNPMFDRYTEGARRVLFFARYELGAFGGTTIEPAHILLGLLRESKGAVAQFLADSHIPPSKLRHEVEQRVPRGPKLSTSVEVPFADATKRILNFAAEEADRLLHRQIEPEHLFLALLREKDPLAAASLTSYGATLDATREYMATRAVAEPDAEVVRAANPLGLTHIERVMELARDLAQAEPNSSEARDLVAQIEDELLMLRLLLK